ncbi:16S rRNA (cytosine(967)-C(5))-methyltransferase RsmB [Hydrogenibacillus schlegelii]|uniref:16S rRNA (cytosine(967)-C(5))-methyltransferase RsmB n=1 Tax=Hydrogenibacillus schlegelii TaxID=1484 RepID=UPI000AFF8FD4|nr:16S rRNA (cytosine(967)-C(5))-methyltransferase RsmB [Hydrogenibacillus schlegelii]
MPDALRPARGARDVAFRLLTRVEEGGAYANLLLRDSPEVARLSPADRALVTELVYGTLAWRARLDHALAAYLDRPPERLEAWFRRLLRMAFYQLLFLDRVPAYAVVHETVALARRLGHEGHARMANAVLRASLRDPKRAAPPEGDDVGALAVRLSAPAWLVERWRAAYGPDGAEALLRAMNAPPALYVRLNRLRPNAEAIVRARLQEAGASLEPVPGLPGAYAVRGPASALKPLLAEGWLTIQDRNAQLIARAMRLKPGLRVYDACAAPGGKATHIAELMDDVGEVVAADIHPHKVRLLEREKARLGLRSLVVRQEDATRLQNLTPASFDRVLVDAPCSGLGTLARKPEIKWRLQPEAIESLAAKQRAILRGAAALVRPGGFLVYSTCTLTWEENEGTVEAFLRERPDFVLDPTLLDDLPSVPGLRNVGPGMVELWPGEGGDGFFLARLRRAPAEGPQDGPDAGAERNGGGAEDFAGGPERAEATEGSAAAGDPPAPGAPKVFRRVGRGDRRLGGTAADRPAMQPVPGKEGHHGGAHAGTGAFAGTEKPLRPSVRGPRGVA